ncbi:MAG: hypothetical protein QOG04_2444 [Actinomycetota bacterium]|jgi:hypothetical protein|nr:hypothetical protein [Actinomycetota bacterium]
MALHDRLRPPTLEPPQRHAGSGLLVALALVVLAAGFAYAMPLMNPVSAQRKTVEEPAAPLPSATPTATFTPAPEETQAADNDEAKEDGTDDHDAEDDGTEKADNHGKVVSIAAHCDVHGQAHGALVSSIAKNKDATVADAEAACAAAMAAAEAETEEPKEHDEPEHAKKVKEIKEKHVPVSTEDHGKPDKPKH